MAIEAPISKYKRNGLLIYMALCLGAAAWFAYDGYYNESFKEKHTEDGKPDSALVFNQKSPPVFLGFALVLGGYLLVIRNKKCVADEKELVIDGGKRIAYDSIQRIDKTHFDSKGYFVLTYKDRNGNEIDCRLNNRRYDNLKALLNRLVAEIS
ncbi:MAG: hypothetical protein JW720_00320 [Sedimentisphaerales bacterium]|nr:hypothetical protein [Sedimentisphaerales bacterium]